MRLPVRWTEIRISRRWWAAAAIAVACTALGLILWAPVRVLGVVRTLDNVFYDSLYRLRGIESKQDGPIVIVTVDEPSIEDIGKRWHKGWPWPRDYWGKVVSYLDSAGAKAIAFDVLFNQYSVYNPDGRDDDDRKFADAVDASATPVVFASFSENDGSMRPIVPPVAKQVLGATNIYDEDVVRWYRSIVNGNPSLAVQTLRSIHALPPAWARAEPRFRLRYYGPHVRNGRPVTFKHVRASHLLLASEYPDESRELGITPELFKDKIVLVAVTAAAGYDLKASPLSSIYPGVELHATAIQNMLADQRVTPVGAPARVFLMTLGCFLAAVGTVFPARVPLKLVGGVVGASAAIGVSAGLFMGQDVRWLPPAAAIAAAVAAAFSGLAWSYFTELRQVRFLRKALAQYVSKEVADQLAKEGPRSLLARLGGQRRDMTVMFTDLENFTTLSESLGVDRLTTMLNFYLEHMSTVIKEGQNGTLDKYIGDAIMSFWNAPLDQQDHAVRACRAALAMQRRERELGDDLTRLAGGAVRSRAGINSGPMVVGNMGSSHKFNYTVLGDSVNLASRLEGANKMYGTRILLSETTASLVKDVFVVRKLDLLRVKGKTQPMGVYELIDEGRPEAAVNDLVARYERAFGLYQARQFDAAHESLDALIRDYPSDGPTATLLDRVAHLRAHPPRDAWDGVYVAKDK